MHPDPDAAAFQTVPTAVLGLVRTLVAAGHEAVLVGGDERRSRPGACPHGGCPAASVGLFPEGL